MPTVTGDLTLIYHVISTIPKYPRFVMWEDDVCHIICQEDGTLGTGSLASLFDFALFDVDEFDGMMSTQCRILMSEEDNQHILESEQII